MYVCIYFCACICIHIYTMHAIVVVRCTVAGSYKPGLGSNIKNNYKSK